MQEVLTEVGRGSGRKGITTILRCLRECPAEVRFEQSTNLPGRLDNSEAIQVGTLCHRMLQEYYSGEPVVHKVVPFEETKEVSMQAERLFAYYAANCPRDEFGEVVGVEEEHPKDSREAQLLSHWIYEGYSCKFDLVIKATEESAAYQADKYGLFLDPGKYYVVDHKFISWFCVGWDDPYMHSIQQTTYCNAFNVIYPDRILGGSIINAVSKGKYPHINRLSLMPTEDDNLVAEYAWELGLKKYEEGHPNPEHCWHYSKNGVERCPFFDMCQRRV